MKKKPNKQGTNCAFTTDSEGRYPWEQTEEQRIKGNASITVKDGSYKAEAGMWKEVYFRLLDKYEDYRRSRLLVNIAMLALLVGLILLIFI